MNKSSTILFVFLAILLLGGLTAFGLKYWLSIAPLNSPRSFEPSVSANTKSESPNTSVKIIERGDAGGQTVEYADTGFKEKEITLVGKNGTGCLITVVNQSSKPLVLRLNPHSATQEQGPSYPEILSGGSIIIDPRFRIEKIAYHDHNRPEKTFRVILDRGCEI